MTRVMTLRKRARVILALLAQTWHERKCPECGTVWFQTGKDNGLMRACANCEADEFSAFLRVMEERFRQERV